MRKIEKEKRKEILKHLDPINFEEIHNLCAKKRLQGTGDWILKRQELIEWGDPRSDSDNRPNILCVQGTAGSGKSCLASKIIDFFSDLAMESDEEIGCGLCLLATQKTRAISAPMRLLSSILHQLCKVRPSDAIHRAFMLGTFRKGEHCTSSRLDPSVKS